MPLAHSVEEISLKNGAKGLLITTPGVTSVRYNIQFRAGNEYVIDQAVSQTAHIMEHMAFGPNAEYASMEDFSRDFSKNGAYHNASTSNVDMVYTASAALMEWDRILRLQLLAITKPVFTEAALKAEKGNVREEIVGYANSHGRLLWQEMMHSVGLNRWLDTRELATIDAVSLDDIKAHHAKTHTPQNMRFVISGDLTTHRSEIIEMLEDAFPAKGERLALPVEIAKGETFVPILRKDLPSVTFNIIFFLGRVLTRAELRAANVMMYIITDTFHSRIWGEARARGICYGMGSWVGTEPTGLTEFGLGGQVSAENTEELFGLIAEKLTQIARDGVTEQELHDAKENRTGGLQMGTETTGSLVNWYAPLYYDFGEIDYVDAMPELIQGTTTESITAIVNEFLKSDAWSFGVIGNIDEAKTQRQYESFKATIGTLKG